MFSQSLESIINIVLYTPFWLKDAQSYLFLYKLKNIFTKTQNNESPTFAFMFTGIIETTGEVCNKIMDGSNVVYWLKAATDLALKIDQSLSHNGVCLTVEAITNGQYKVTAIAETLKKTTLAQWQIGDNINLERCMLMNGRLDGHIVQGHVDATAKCTQIEECEGSKEFSFSFSKEYAHLVIEKGSIAVNGISLTCFNVTDNSFTVAIIPYTLTHTSIKNLLPDTCVNIEFDLIGKYIARMQSLS